MRSAHYVCLIFALIALKASCDPKWVNKSFSIPPNLFITNEILPIPPVTIIVDLLPGPAPQTNLFCMGSKIGTGEFNDISILNTTSLASIREFFDVGSLYPLATVAIVSLPGSVFYTAVIKDDDGLSQILGFPMPAGAYFPEEFSITDNKDKDSKFKVFQLLANGPNPVVVYSEKNKDNFSLIAARVLPSEKKVDKRIFITNGNVSNVTCDIDFKTTNLFCLYKLDNEVLRAFVSLTDENASPMIVKEFNTDAKALGARFVPQKVIALKDRFISLTSRMMEGKMDIIAQVFNPKTDTRSTSPLEFQSLKDLQSDDEKPIQGAIAHGDGFIVFFREMVDSNKNQTWSYRIFDSDLTAKKDEVKLADVGGADSEFRVAKEFGAGAINIAAWTYVEWHGAIVLNLYYGQIKNETPF